MWRLDRAADGEATLVVSHARLAKRAAQSLAAEGRRFLSFAAAEATAREVQLVAIE